ncbi:RidA family protein [Methylobacterium sp. JK268]
MMTIRPGVAACLLLGAALAGGGARAQEVVRHRIPNSDFPIAQAVEVPAGRTTVYVSGAVPPVLDEAAPKNTVAAYGDTRTQASSVLKAIDATLKRLNLGMGDVVKMTVFLVGDPAKEGRMDFAGFMTAYREHFGTPAQPNLPARSVVQVAGLANPGYLVEIEVTAVRP